MRHSHLQISSPVTASVAEDIIRGRPAHCRGSCGSRLPMLLREAVAMEADAGKPRLAPAAGAA